VVLLPTLGIPTIPILRVFPGRPHNGSSLGYSIFLGGMFKSQSNFIRYLTVVDIINCVSLACLNILLSKEKYYKKEDDKRWSSAGYGHLLPPESLSREMRSDENVR
jgi:hypothetical protein